MPRSSDLDRVTMIVLRFMRGPIVLLISVYAIGITGMAVIPGPEVDGEPTHMSFFHAFYFMTYTATTTGFGELPIEFSEAQRMWAIACLYLSVVAWFYSIGTIVRLVQNPYFRQALAQYTFAISVARIAEPFVLICGFGDTGSLLARGLSDRLIKAVVIDTDPERIKALGLRDYWVKMPGLCGDASVPKQLLDAGLNSRRCTGVVALTRQDEKNLDIAVMVRAMNPSVPIICRCTSRRFDEEFKALSNVAVLDPFETFSEQLTTALQSPALHTLDEWFLGVPGVTLDRTLGYPVGNWVVCGHGRMGQWLFESLRSRSVPVVAVDPRIPEDMERSGLGVRGDANRETLLQAGVREAVGIIAATNNDSVNLRTVMNARSLNPEVFVVVRQNRHENAVAFSMLNANLIMEPSLVTAQRALLRLVAPPIGTLFERLEDCEGATVQELFTRLKTTVRETNPTLWLARLTRDLAPALARANELEQRITLGDLTRDPSNRNRCLPCVPLVAERGGNRTVLPGADFELREGDALLLCGTRSSRYLLDATLGSWYTLNYLVSSVEPPRGYFMRWVERARARK